jgi:hypothetical protein
MSYPAATVLLKNTTTCTYVQEVKMGLSEEHYHDAGFEELGLS